MSENTNPSIRLDFVGGSDDLTVSELSDLLESDQTADEALETLAQRGNWVDQNRLVEHGPRGYREARVVNAEAFAQQRNAAAEDRETNSISLRFEDSDALRAALEYLGENDAPVCIDEGHTVIDGVRHDLWDQFDAAMNNEEQSHEH